MALDSSFCVDSKNSPNVLAKKREKCNRVVYGQNEAHC